MLVEIANPIEQEVLDLFDEFESYMKRKKEKSNFMNTQYEYNGGFIE